MDETIIFNTEALADAAVMGIHQSFGETNSYRGRYLAYFGVNTDCEIFNNSGMNNVETDKEGSLVTYSAKPDNTYMNTDNNAWAKLYEAIERANKGIKAMRENSDLTNTNIVDLTCIYLFRFDKSLGRRARTFRTYHFRNYLC